MGTPVRRVKRKRWLIPAAAHNFDIRIVLAFDIDIVD
jgi:hypothetical protein